MLQVGCCVLFVVYCFVCDGCWFMFGVRCGLFVVLLVVCCTMRDGCGMLFVCCWLCVWCVLCVVAGCLLLCCLVSAGWLCPCDVVVVVDVLLLLLVVLLFVMLWLLV